MFSGFSDKLPIRFIMSIQAAISVINDMKNDGVIQRYAIGGAVGATFYIEPAETEDIDVFVTLEAAVDALLVDLAPIYSYLKSRGATVEGQYIVVEGWPVQILMPNVNSSLDAEALEQAVDKPYHGITVPVFTAEHLAAKALELGRPKDRVRLAQFAAPGVLDSAKFQAILERHKLVDKWLQFRRSISGNA